MSIYGIGPPEVAIIVIVAVMLLLPVIAFVLIYRRLGEIRNDRRPQTSQPPVRRDVRRDDA